MSRASALITAMLLAATAPLPAQPSSPDAATVRRELGAVNAAWSRIRQAYNRPAADSLLTPDFHAAL